MNRNFEFEIATNLAKAVDEFAYEHYMGALYYLRAARSHAHVETRDVSVLAWFTALEAVIINAMEAHYDIPSDIESYYAASMRAYELGW